MKGVSMVDRAQTRAVSKADYGRFFAAGVRVVGAYHCSNCTYGVTVRGELPACPMCSGESWEPAAWRPFSGSGKRLQ
jgi:hypothetical protein